MPRSDSKGSSSEPYDSLASPTNSTSSQTSSGMTSLKKKHVCPTCDRAFTTSGHLARHSRVHTGEKNHKCPFPGCETRCSRQDNLQQHYRIHLSPGSRRTSSRSSRSSRSVSSRRGANSGLGSASSSNTPYPPPNSPPALTNAVSNLPIPPPPLSPPPLEPAHSNGPQGRMMYAQHSPPPDSPPALAPATLSVQQPSQAQYMTSRSANSSPDGMYSTPSFASPSGMNAMSSMDGQSSHSPTIPAPGYSYRIGTSSYQEQATSGNGGYTYVPTNPMSGANSDYSSSAPNTHPLPHINTLNYNSSLSRSGSPSLSANSHNSSAPVSASASPLSSVSSRHSISHISHAQSYPPMQSQSSAQVIGHSPSPVSANSNSSHGLPPLSNNVYSDPSASNADSLSHSPQYDNMVNASACSSPHPHSMPSGTTTNPNYSPALSVQSNGSAGSMPTMSQPLSQHGSGQNILGPSLSRFDSPPPVLAPLQGYNSAHHDLPPARMIEERYNHGHNHSHGSGSTPNAPQRSYSDRYEAMNQTQAHNGGYSRGGYGGRYSTDDSYMGHHTHGSLSSNAYGNYGGGMGSVSLGHGAWKGEANLGRSMKGIGALVQ